MDELVAMHREVEPALQNTVQLMEKAYLHKLTDYSIVSTENKAAIQNSTRQIRLFQIEKIVYDKKEDIAEKLVNVYNTLGNLNNSLFLIIDSDGSEVEFYIGTRSERASVAQESLMKSMRGNFPGTSLKKVRNSDYLELMNKVTIGSNERLHRTVAGVSGIPAMKDTDKQTYVQGLEKLVNAMYGEKFSMIILADAVSPEQSSIIRQGYENMYSAISRFQKVGYSAGENESAALTESMSEGLSETINESIGQTQSYTKTNTNGKSNSTSIGANIGFGKQDSVTGGVSLNKSYTRSSSESISEADAATNTTGTSHSKSANTTTSTSKTDGTSRTIQVNVEDKRVTELLEKIDLHLNRLNSAADLGLWHYAAYFLADDEQTATIAAANYQSIIRGAESAIEGSAINIWNSDHPQNLQLRESLKVLRHPRFHIDRAGIGISTGSTLVNTRELSIACGLPRKSINGLPVIEMAEFGRDVSILSSKEGQATVNVGSIYYMGEKDSTPVNLDVKSLAMHTFITGSTGSGKSNTVYQMLDELLKENVKFLVIEPAKGEYKNVFGGYKNVHVFGTNPKFTPLLKINPFYFPDNIHVLEHIERLIEIFNACWPMYAAMPAVLREAVEEVYRGCGWKLDASINFNRIAQYPTMQQLVQVLPDIIEKSGYSEEVKSNYVGALVTRVKSLMTGLLSNVFVEDEIDNEILFDENCIIDLSLIGSVETKSLVMGILFMRLQEHRMASADGMNVPLKHVTVLEEAHHLLRRTSDVHTAEGSNLQGKSVEMITNGIAEMRTYGEGFIIADQSPNLLDPSAIRNTNTKIIMQLPDAADRVLVGASAGLNEEQLKEISKLGTGVAVVYQNNWLEPVLCQVHPFDAPKKFIYSFDMKKELRERRENASYIIEALLSKNIDKQTFIRVLETNTKMPRVNRVQLLKEVANDIPLTILQRGNEVALGEVINSYVLTNELLPYAQTASTLEEFNLRFQKALTIYVDSPIYKEIIQELLLMHYSASHPSFRPFYLKWFEHKKQEVTV